MNRKSYRVVAHYVLFGIAGFHLGACGTQNNPDSTCSDAACTAPPVATCQGDNLVAYGSAGTCDESGQCAYEQVVTNCAENDARCDGGECVSNPSEDPCDDVVCDAPPASICDGDDVVSYAAAGTCVGGVCQYESTQTSCGEGEECNSGACEPIPDPCDDVVCDSPPAAQCEGNALVAYGAIGLCELGECRYESSTTACDAGEICSGGACFSPTETKIVLTEIHYNPAVSQGDDADFEFIELYNAGVPVNLEGFYFTAGMTHTFGSYDFATGTYLVLAANALSYPNVDALEWESGALSNSGETVTLVDADGTEMDSVTYDDGGEWTSLADGAGYSLELLDFALDNALGANWQASFLAGGSPGSGVSQAPSPLSLTVNEIRSGDHIGTFVSTGGVVTGAFPDMNRFSIQDGTGAFSGLWVEGVGVVQGDHITVTGPVADDNGRLMVFATSVVVEASNEPMPVAEILTTAGAAEDAWEGVVVEVTATCNQAELGYGEWGIDDGSGMLRVDDLGYAYDAPVEGVEYRVTGPLDYSFDQFKIALRDESDVALVDPCSVVTCNAPPVDHCDNNQLVSYSETGTCVDGSCEYSLQSDDCGDLICVQTGTGATCVADPCDAFDCSEPALHCEGNSVVSYTGDGVCQDASGCDFSAVQVFTDCGDGTCYAGVCYALPGAADLVITEYMANPDATDDNYEWFEVYNPLNVELYLGGMVVDDGASDSFTVATGIVIQAESHFVFGQSEDAIPGGPNYNWQGIGNFRLSNTSDGILLSMGGVSIDSVLYDDCSGCFPHPSGASVSLDGGSYAADNADSSLWCVGVEAYDPAGNLGTPGSQNATCP